MVEPSPTPMAYLLGGASCGRPLAALDPQVTAGELAFRLHTSGPTGLPKAVSYAQWRLARRSQINAVCGLEPGCVYAGRHGTSGEVNCCFP